MNARCHPHSGIVQAACGISSFVDDTLASTPTNLDADEEMPDRFSSQE